MIDAGTGVRVYLACGVTDMRKGIAVLAQDVLDQKSASGAVFAFRGWRGDRLKLLYWDGQRFCLCYKLLERGRFPWPSAQDGAVRLTSAQLAMLWEGIGWRRPDWGAPPARVGGFCARFCIIYRVLEPDFQELGACQNLLKICLPLGTLLRNTLPGSGAAGTGARRPADCRGRRR